MDKDSKGHRKLEDSAEELLPSVKGHILEHNRIDFFNLRSDHRSNRSPC